MELIGLNKIISLLSTRLDFVGHVRIYSSWRANKESKSRNLLKPQTFNKILLEGVANIDSLHYSGYQA